MTAAALLELASAKAWPKVQLGDVLEVQNGFAFSSKKFSEKGGVPLIRIRDLKDNGASAVGFLGDYDAAYVVNDGDLLIGMDGEFRCYEWRGGPALLNQRVCRLVNFDGQLHPRFLFHGINKHLKEIEDETSFTTVKHLSSKTVKAIEFPLPPLEEQKRIVAVLDQAFAALDRAHALAEANLADAEEFFDSWASDAFRLEGSDRPTVYLPDISENLDRSRVPITKADRKPGNVPYYGASGEVDRVADFIFDEDLLLVSEDGANLLARTYPIAFSISGKSWVNNHAHVLRFRNPTDQEYVRLYLNSIPLDDFVSGMAQPKLNQKALNSIPIPFPPDEERARIVEKAAEIAAASVATMDIYAAQLTDVAELRQSLLQRAFAGELT